MQTPAADSAVTGLAVIIFILFLAFLPVLIANSRTGKILQAATFTLCLTSLAGTFGAMFLGGLGGMIVLPALSAMWLASLLCALAACLNTAAERRFNDLSYRMIYSESENLTPPRGVSSKRLEPR